MSGTFFHATELPAALSQSFRNGVEKSSISSIRIYAAIIPHRYMDQLFKFCKKYEELASVERGWKEQIPGGLARGKKPRDFSKKQLAKGLKVEMEHTDDPHKALEIAMDHLMEDSKYYNKLEKMESEFEDDDEKKKKEKK
jgi:hypothetical protein